MNSEMPSTPFFTVIIATYNAEATVLKSLESVLSQTEQPQVVLVDGLSKDRTVELVRPYETRGVEIISERDEGVYDAWNKGIRKATGEWIIFLGADDYYPHPECLAILRKHLVTAPQETKVAYGRIHVVDRSGKVIAEENEPWEQCKMRLSINMPYTHVGSAHRAGLFKEKIFNSSYKIAGDYQFLYSELRNVPPIYVREYVTIMSDGGLSTAFKNRLRLLNEIILIRRQFKIRVPVLNKIWTLIKVVVYKFASVAVNSK